MRICLSAYLRPDSYRDCESAYLQICESANLQICESENQQIIRIFAMIVNQNLMNNQHDIKVRVRYAETDQMGVVYHGNYAQYFEMGRVEWMRNKGLSYKKMEESGIMLPVVSLKMDYKKPAKYDDLLTVTTILKSQSSVKIEFDYEIRNEAGDLLTTGYSMLVFVNMKTGKPVVPPAELKAIIEKI